MADFDPSQPFEKVEFAPPAEFDANQPFEPAGQRSASGAVAEGFGALKDSVLPTKAALQRGKGDLRNAGNQIAETSHSYKSYVLKQASDVDYDTGAPYATQVDLQRSSNADEAKATLEDHFGKGNAGQDEAGRWWVNDNGKKIAVFGNGALGNMKSGAAGMQAAGPEMIGAVAGGVLGAPGGPAGMVAGSALGAVAGKGVDETAKWLQGFYRKTPQELAESALHTAEWNAAFSAAGPVAKQVFSPIGNALRNVLGVTPTTRAMTEEALRNGVVPPITSIAPEFKSMADKQKLRNTVMGDPKLAPKVAAVQSQMRDALQSEGYTPIQIDRLMSEVFDPTTALAESEVGKVVAPKVQAYAKGLAEGADRALETAQTVAAQNKKLFETLASRAKAGLGTDLAGELQQSREQVGKVFGPVYDHIDEMVGGRAIIPMMMAKREAAFMTRHIPPDRVPPIFKEMAEAPDFMKPSDAHRLRSQLRGMADSHNMTPDISNHEFGKLATAVDSGFEAATNGRLPASDIFQETRDWLQVNKAVPFMRKADRMYGEQIRFYKDARVNEIAKLAEAGMPPDPAEVARLVSEVGFTERTKQIINKLTPEAKRDLAAADMQMMFNDTERLTRQLGFDNSGRAFYSTVNERRPLLEAVYEPVYGKTFVERLENSAKELAALDGNLDLKALQEKIKGLGPGAMLDALGERVSLLKRAKAFAEGNPLAALQSGNPDAIDQGFRTIVQPQADARLQAAYQFFGEGIEMDAIRNYARKQMLWDAVFETPSRVQMINGQAIEKAFSKYTPYQKEVLFPNGGARDLLDIAKMSRFLFPEMMEEAGTSLAAKAITQHVGPFILNPRTAYADARWIYVYAMGWLADRPMVARALAGIEKKEPGVAKVMLRKLFRWAATEQAHSGPGRGKPSPDESGGDAGATGEGAASFDPASIGAQQAPDGHWYLPPGSDPAHPDKYMRVEQ